METVQIHSSLLNDSGQLIAGMGWPNFAAPCWYACSWATFSLSWLNKYKAMTVDTTSTF
jgi:hypothetical protein